MPNYKKVLSQLNQVAKESGKSAFKVIGEYVMLRQRKCLYWNEYYNFEFDRQNRNFKNDFLGGREQGVYLELLNPFKYYILARNKFLAHLVLEQAGIPTPELYCYYSPENGSQVEERTGFDLQSVKDILEKKQVKECVIKATEGSHGDNVFAVNRIEYEKGDALFELSDGTQKRLSAVLGHSPLLFEQKIRQSQQLGCFNPSSVNTIRFMTTLMPTGEAKVIATFIKIGRSGAFVDNAGGGGNVDAGINVETGEIYGAIEFNGFRKTRPIDCHPDTGAQLNGVVIEHWDEICARLCRFQQRLPFLKSIGWDVAITDDGPVVIEINDFWDTTGQLFIQKGWRDAIRTCYIEWKKYNKIRKVEYKMGRNNPASIALIQKLENI